MSGVEILLIATAVSAAGSIAAGVAANRQAQYQASVARNNAAFGAAVAKQNEQFYMEVGESNAAAAVMEASAEEDTLRRERNRRLALAAAKFGASGVQLAGTPIDVLADDAATYEAEALNVRRAGQVRARDARLNASVLARRERLVGIGALFEGQTTSHAYEQQAGAALLGGFTTAGASTLRGISDSGVLG